MLSVENRLDPEIKSLFQTLIEGQIRTDQSLNTLAVTVEKYVDAADSRMKRIEENLDGLIRAITREHTNGKGQA
jgi:hypothetical protein